MTDVDAIYAEVERRKKRARDLGLPNGLPEFYQQFVRLYPIWQERFPNWVPPGVESATDLKEQGIQFSYMGIQYRFVWSERSFPMYDDYGTFGYLEIFADGERMFRLQLSPEVDRNYGETSWCPGDIEAFIEGPWIEDLKRLARLATAHHEKELRLAAKHRREDPALLADLQTRFGIVALSTAPSASENSESPLDIENAADLSSHTSSPTEQANRTPQEIARLPKPISWWKRLRGHT